MIVVKAGDEEASHDCGDKIRQLCILSERSYDGTRLVLDSRMHGYM